MTAYQIKISDHNVVYQFRWPVQDCGSCNKQQSYINQTIASLSRRLVNYLSGLHCVKKYLISHIQLPAFTRIILVDKNAILRTSNFRHIKINEVFYKKWFEPIFNLNFFENDKNVMAAFKSHPQHGINITPIQPGLELLLLLHNTT